MSIHRCNHLVTGHCCLQLRRTLVHLDSHPILRFIVLLLMLLLTFLLFPSLSQ